jgi:hypothetical protein
MNPNEVVPLSPRIFTVRKVPVMLDSDLALLYGVTTGNFNKAVQRNEDRFPDEFSFVLTREEFTNLIFQIGRSSGYGGRRKLPRVFTEHGAIMAAMILNSKRAVAMSVYVIRAFVNMRQEFLANATLEARLEKIEKTLLSHDAALRDVIQRLRPLLLPPSDPPKRRIGFNPESKK